MKLIDDLRARRREKQQTDAQNYRELVRELAAGKPRKRDPEEVAGLLDRLNLDEEQLAAAVVEEQRLDALRLEAAKIADLEEAWRGSRDKLRALEAERVKAVEELDARIRETNAEGESLHRALGAARQARGEVLKACDVDELRNHATRARGAVAQTERELEEGRLTLRYREVALKRYEGSAPEKDEGARQAQHEHAEAVALVERLEARRVEGEAAAEQLEHELRTAEALALAGEAD